MALKYYYPAFLRFFTKKSFSLVRTSSFDFLNSSLISIVKFLLILLEFINLKLLKKNDISNTTDLENKMWTHLSKKRKYFILHIEDLI